MRRLTRAPASTRSSTFARVHEPWTRTRVSRYRDLIAFLDRADRYHAEAVRLFANPPRRWHSSLAVVSETYGWFLHRLGEDAARTFRLALGELPRLELLTVDVAVHDAVVRKLERRRDRKLTYVDASSLVFLERLRIGEVWGTDRDLSLEGARVVPVG